MKALGERGEGAALDASVRGLPPPSFPQVLLDSVYFGGLLFSIPYLLVRGKRRRLVDHIRRRVQDVPERRSANPCVWVHGVSVGEILSASRFLEVFSAEYPDWEIVLSSTTRAGLDAGRRHYAGTEMVNGNPIFTYPFDLSFLVRRAFDRIRPSLVLIVEHELWPNFLWHARERGTPVAIINGRLSERSLRGYRWLSRLLAWPPPGIELFCVEDALSAERFRLLGVPDGRIKVTGNFKFDNVPPRLPCVRRDLGFGAEDWVFVGASVHPGEEAAVLGGFDALRREDPACRLLLAPRRLENVEALARDLERRSYRVERWSRGRLRSGDAAPRRQPADAVLVDTFGDLPRLMAAGDAVFVGGSLIPFGGHNVVEPASLELPVLVGPHHHNFQHVVSAFRRRDGIALVDGGESLARALLDLKRHPQRARALARRASETVAAETGSSLRTLDALRPLIRSILQRS